jgi:hypothetical protein
MARYRMTVVFDVHDEVEMKYVYLEDINKDKTDIGSLPNEASVGRKLYSYDKGSHINKLYEDVLERIETSTRHPITYDIVSFEKLEQE